MAETCLPDVFVMDLGLPDGSGIDATAAVVRVSPVTWVLVLTGHDDIAYLRRAFEAGAAGYLIKDAATLSSPRVSDWWPAESCMCIRRWVLPCSPLMPRPPVSAVRVVSCRIALSKCCG